MHTDHDERLPFWTSPSDWQGTVRELDRAVGLELLQEVFQSPANGLDETVSSNAVVLGYFLGGHLRAVACIAPLKADSRRAQISLLVQEAWRGCGIGTMLMAAVVAHARENGIASLHLQCHTLNSRMQHIAERFGATIGFEDCSCFVHIEVENEVLAC